MGLTPIEHASLRWTHWSAKTKSDPGTLILTPQSLGVDIHGEGRRVWASLQRDGSSERDAVCFEAEASESWRQEFQVPNWSAVSTCCNELPIVSRSTGRGLR